MKKSMIILCLLLISGIVAASGCTSDSSSDINREKWKWGYQTQGDYDSMTGYGWSVILTDDTYGSFLQEMSEEKALINVTDKEIYDEEGWTKLLDSGTKTMEGINVYYNKYQSLDEDGLVEAVEGIIIFKKDGRWYKITWKDRPLEPNQKDVEKEISYYLQNAGTKIPVAKDHT